jgi:hypothetical protein
MIFFLFFSLLKQFFIMAKLHFNFNNKKTISKIHFFFIKHQIITYQIK